MPLIVAEGLGKSYGGRRLFDDAAFQVEAGERVAVVGPNGAGKTTLLRILAGQERPDHGSLRLAAVRSHWFDQHPKFAPDAVARSLLAAPPPPAVAAELAALEARIADPALYEQPGYEAVLERYAALERQARHAEPADPAMLRELDVTHLDQRMASLSGGERTRLFLARILSAARPGDLLVLDEPTNHLDVDAIEWLEEWLSAFQGTVLVVAHDRVFLDNVATRVFEVAQGRLTAYAGNYEDYVQARDEQREREQREHQKAQDRVQQAKATIQQFRHQKRFDGQYASRMKALDKYKAALERTPDPVLARLGFGLKFDAVQKSSEEVFRFSGLEKAFEGRAVLDGAELELRKGDRVGLVGANGSGKSTLLKILTGKLPKDGGSVHVAPGVRGVFFNQEQDDLQPTRTLHEEVLEARPGLEERDVKALLGRFRFDPETRRTVSTLSGGERQRLMLLKCVLKPSNLLILDEPTNHLDLWAREVVVDALNAYPGTLLVVSHDRFLLDAVTEKTAVLEDGRLHVYPGSFTETRDQHRRRTAVRRSERYVVRKKFTDWTTNTKYAPGAEVEFSEAQVEGSMTLRNAIGQGWLERRP